MEPIFASDGGAKFNATLSTFTTDFNQYIYPCLYGDGNMQVALPVGDGLSALDDFDKFLNITTMLGTLIESPSIAGVKEIIQKRKDGVYPIDTTSIPIIGAMNAYTDSTFTPASL